MAMSLEKLLGLVGGLDDAEGDDTAQARFRRFIEDSVRDAGVLRDYMETCVRESGTQYNRALQDLVNRLGKMLGFSVTYGRYAGKKGEIGFDGHWVSPNGTHVVVEVKTTDVYAIKTATLLNYVNELVSEGTIPQEATCLGMYVVGRYDAELAQLESAIMAEGRLQQLRIVSVDSLVSLTELATEYDVTHDAIVSVLLPSGARIDPTVDLMAELVGQARSSRIEDKPSEEEAADRPTEGPAYYVTPVRWKGYDSPMACVGRLLTNSKYAFAEGTPCRRDVRAGDFICFYASGMGVFAHAQVESAPRHNPLPDVTNEPDSYPFTFDLRDVEVYEDSPVTLTAEVRAKLDALRDSDPSKNWGWFVTPTRRISKEDFKVLTGQDN